MSEVKILQTQPRERTPIEKAVVLAIVVIPLFGTLYAMVMLWQRYVDGLDVALMLIFYYLSGFGITVGFHRLLTHRSFETYPAVKRILLLLGSLALEGNPSEWASVHLEHHANADEEGDPHSPMVSLWHAHIGWLFEHVAQPEVYGRWLLRDPIVVFVDKTWLMWGALGLVIPFAIAGWSGLIWGGLVRIFVTHHVAWSVNSICHAFGKRPYPTRDASRNNWLVGLLALGEGWHNNHHAFPRSAFHGLRWWEIDLSAYVIRALAATGLAWNVHYVQPEEQRTRRLAVR
jgi:stearoyl-CoA desaturase (delta-9 desaturase)